MKTRIITGLIFAATMFGGIYGGKYTYGILFGIVTILCLWEFLSAGLESNLFRKLLGVVLGAIPFIISYEYLVLYQDTRLIHVALALFFPILFLLFIYELYQKSEKPFTNLGYICLGIFYIGIPFALLNFIAFKGGIYKSNIVMGILLMTWANDTFAYFAGSWFGKTKLFERISPKKTWEGTIGGVIGTILTGVAFYYIFNELRLVDWMVIGGLVAIFGGLSDLVESMLKRSLKIKDSGTLLPGHGGFLDRFDAFFFLLPFVAAYILLFT